MTETPVVMTAFFVTGGTVVIIATPCATNEDKVDIMMTLGFHLPWYFPNVLWKNSFIAVYF